MELFDDLNELLEKNNQRLYGTYSTFEKELINKWNNLLGSSDALSYTIFRDANFLHIFIKVIPESVQFNYVINTYNQFMGIKYDPKYALVSRRSIPSKIAKPEAFWTTEHREVIAGLTNEMPIGSPKRIYSYIMVSTMEKLINHGLSYTNNGSSDGEIVIDPTKPFNDFLFIYKPESELKEMQDYINSGGIDKEIVLEMYENTSEARLQNQGFEHKKIN